MRKKLINGECMETMKRMKNDCVDSMVTDPPAGISFMNKGWDSDKGGRDAWIKEMELIYRECYRVMKPGSHGFVWALPRTSHWTATSLENSGFEIRDIVTHVFGSGFPKSLNIGKAIDKKLGCEREVIGKKVNMLNTNIVNNGMVNSIGNGNERIDLDITSPSSPQAIQWEGWGTGLKPASEHWILIRKPISEKTIVENVLRWGVGGINIDGSRIESDDNTSRKCYDTQSWKNTSKNGVGTIDDKWKEGRFPANFIHDGSEEVVEQFPNSKSNPSGYNFEKGNNDNPSKIFNSIIKSGKHHNDDGSASRFFYCSKASTSEKNKGCEELEDKKVDSISTGMNLDNKYTVGHSQNKTPLSKKNIHPTVKPVKLMKYLITMITPPNGVVLDPFMGSGSTGVSCGDEFRFIGIEREQEYFDIAEKRITINL